MSGTTDDSADSRQDITLAHGERCCFCDAFLVRKGGYLYCLECKRWFNIWAGQLFSTPPPEGVDPPKRSAYTDGYKAGYNLGLTHGAERARRDIAGRMQEWAKDGNGGSGPDEK